MKINALIIDDERRARSILKKLLEKQCPEVSVIGEAQNLPNGVEMIKETSPDVVFLDIDMPEYAGYEIGKFLKKIDFDIVFVTAYDNYAVKAFELAAVDYIVKPVNIDRLVEATKKLKGRKELRTSAENYKVLLNSLQKKEETSLLVPFKGSKKIILLKDIVAIEANTAYCNIHTKSKEVYLYSKNLKFFEELLETEDVFFRAHKSWIVNKNFIESYSKSKFTIQLSSGIEAKLSKFKKAEFEQKGINK